MGATSVNSGASPAPSSAAVHAQGDFSSSPAPDLLVDLVRRHFTGTLRVERSGIVKVLYFSQGDLACASSNAEEDRLGNILVRSGRLSAEQLAHAKARQSAKTSIGNTLVELGFITAAELLDGARQQVEEILLDLVGWGEGTYLAREVGLSREVVNLGLPGRSLLVRALQQAPDRDLVVERLGSMDAVLSRVEPFDEPARALDFGLPVDATLAAVDGQRSVRAICEAAGIDDFQTCKVLYTLLAFGLVQHAAPAPARELIFVEGELQSGEEIPRAGERLSRRARRQAAGSNGAAKVPPLTAVPPPPPVEEESPTPTPRAFESATPEPAAETPDEQTPAGIPGAPPRRSTRRLVWGGALALGLVALLAGILYFTYFRPILSSDDAEEARLLAALMEEAQQEGARVPDASSPRENATGAPPTVRPPHETAAAPPPAPSPRQEVGTAPPPKEAAAGPAPHANAPPRPAPRGAPALEKSPLPTMLMTDGNFRRALELVPQRRFTEAAESFQRALQAQSSGTHTVQLLLACQDSTLGKAYERAPGRTLYFVQTTFRGETCYRLFDGLYSSEAEARRNLEDVPAVFFQDGNQPVVVRAPRR
jgi:hypothetical protein